MFTKILIVSASLLTIKTSDLHAATVDHWIDTATIILAEYEGSHYGKVTADDDCQGLSLGIQQNPIQNGGLRTLVRKVGIETSIEIAQNSMPVYGDTFIEIIRLMEEGEFSKARRVSLGMQGVHSTKQCGGGIRGKDMKLTAKQELTAWLESAEVKQAQIHLKNRAADEVLKITHCWKQEFGSGDSITFPEFLFHFDFVTQGGLGGLRNKSLYESSQLVRDFRSYGETPEQRKLRKIRILQTWLRTDWPDANATSYYVDSKRNAEVLQEKIGSISMDEIHLLFVRLQRAMTGNTPYQHVFMNRGVIDLMGYGRMNNTEYDFRDLIENAGELDGSAFARVQC